MTSATYDDVCLAILAMDVYHRGPANVAGADTKQTPGLNVNASQIGTAIAIGDWQTPNQAWQDVGFFAQAYSWEGKTVVAYRGTDEGFIGSNDSKYGFGVTTGDPTTLQAQAAIQFYKDATSGGSIINGNVIVTGQ